MLEGFQWRGDVDAIEKHRGKLPLAIILQMFADFNSPWGAERAGEVIADRIFGLRDVCGIEFSMGFPGARQVIADRPALKPYSKHDFGDVRGIRNLCFQCSTDMWPLSLADHAAKFPQRLHTADTFLRPPHPLPSYWFQKELSWSRSR